MPASRFGRSVGSAIKAQTEAVEKELVKPVEDATRSFITEFNEVTRQWSSKPKWVEVLKVSRTRIEGGPKPTGDNAKIWFYVDLGTKPHKIRAKNAPALSFVTGYQPRTKPVARFNVGPGKATGARVFAQEVDHPGNKPRDFARTYAKVLQPGFRLSIVSAIRRAVAASK